MNWLPQSIRWHLQMWHGLLLLVVLGGFGMTAWKLEQGSEMGRVDAEIQPLTAVALGMFHRPRDGPGPPGGGPPGGPPRRPRDLFDPLSSLAEDRPPPPPTAIEIDNWLSDVGEQDGFFVAWGFRGEPLIQRGALARSIQRPDSADYTPLAPRAETLMIAGTPVRVMVVATPNEDIAVIGRVITPELARLESLKWSLAGLGAGVWLVGFFVGWWLTGRALRPIQTISAAATRIADGHLNERINVAETKNELGDLANVLNGSFDKLEHSIEKQAEFTADAAHELRTPVSVVLTQTQLALARERDAAEYRDALAACERAAKRMSSLTESLLQLSRLDAHAEPMHMQTIDLSDVVVETAEMLRPLADERGVTLEVHVEPARCQGDAEKLGQVFTNLLSNALHHSSAGKRVHLRCGMNGEGTKASVEDEGSGIAAQHLPFLFDRFYRADESRNRNTGGAGLGLAICKAIVAQHHGSIEARSEPGKGSTFVVKLPAV